MSTVQAQVVQLITSEAQRQGLDPNIALAVARQESGFNQAARGPGGEIGVFQLMPGTARDLGVNPLILMENIGGGIAYLKQGLNAFGGDLAKALAAYNAGIDRVSKAVAAGADWFARIPASTQGYVSKIMASLGLLVKVESTAAPGLPILYPTFQAAGSLWPLALLAAGAATIYFWSE